MSNLEQLKLTYDPVQDRLILIFFTRDFSEFRFWLTRRMTKKLWELFKQIQANMIKSVEEQKFEAEKAEKNVQREAVQQEASKYGMQLTRNPLGNDPVLLMQVQVGTNEQGQMQCRLESNVGTHIDFNFDVSFVMLILQLIEKAIPYTEWDLKLGSP